jgi:hypothetical protein
VKRYRATAFLLACLLGLLLATACSSTPSPQIGDHWHASYAIDICGHRTEILPEFEGGTDTRGDGVIHVHPTQPEEEGAGARLVEFFRNAGGALSQGVIGLPGERAWQTGNVCSGGRPGRVVVVVNEGPLGLNERSLGKELDTYVPQDGDRILIAFVPSGSAAPAVPPQSAAAID